MPPDLCQYIEAMGMIFTVMEKRRKEDPEDFADLLEQAGGDFGIAYAYYFMLVEDDLTEEGKIRRNKKDPKLLECIYDK